MRTKRANSHVNYGLVSFPIVNRLNKMYKVYNENLEEITERIEQNTT